MIFAARLQQSQPGSVAAVYTFGSPPVGDAAWVQAYDSLGLDSITFRWARPHLRNRSPMPSALQCLSSSTTSSCSILPSCRYINYKDIVPRLPSADAHVGQQYYLDGVEQTGASMCALGDPGSGIPAYCTAARWANGSAVLGAVLQTGGEGSVTLVGVINLVLIPHPSIQLTLKVQHCVLPFLLQLWGNLPAVLRRHTPWMLTSKLCSISALTRVQRPPCRPACQHCNNQ